MHEPNSKTPSPKAFFEKLIHILKTPLQSHNPLFNLLWFIKNEAQAQELVP
jgi:hypothetical protein